MGRLRAASSGIAHTTQTPVELIGALRSVAGQRTSDAAAYYRAARRTTVAQQTA